MTKLGRKPNAVPTIDWKCYVPVNIAAQVDLLLTDPLTGKPKLGARSELVTKLLMAWLASRKSGHSQPIDPANPI